MVNKIYSPFEEKGYCATNNALVSEVLSKRTMFHNKYEKKISTLYTINSEVPQGSILDLIYSLRRIFHRTKIQ